jgi:hypothetical protein
LETNVWKKAGIVVAASLAAVLALAPFAHADPAPEGEDRADDVEQVVPSDDAPPDALINLGDIKLLNDVNICPDLTAVVAVGNVLGILGLGSANPSVADAPIICVTTAPPRKP